MRLRRNGRRVNRENSRSATARYIFHARDLAPWSEVGKSGAASVKSLNADQIKIDALPPVVSAAPALPGVQCSALPDFPLGARGTRCSGVVFGARAATY